MIRAKAPSQAMFSGLRDGLALLLPRERRDAVLQLGSTMINGLLQTAALAAIAPFVQALMEPERLAGRTWWIWIAQFLPTELAERPLVAAGFLLMLLVVLKTLYAGLHVIWQTAFIARCETRLGIDLLNRMLNAPYIWSLSRNSAILREVVMGHTVNWSRGFIQSLQLLLNDLMFAVFILLTLIIASPVAGVVVAAVSLLMAQLLLRAVRPKVFRHAEAKRAAGMSAGLMATQSLAGFKDVKISGMQGAFLKLFARDFHIYSSNDALGRRWQQVPKLGLELVGYSTLVIISLVAVGSGAERGEVVSLIALYALAAIRMLPVLSNVVSAISNLVNIFPVIAELNEVRRSTAVPEPVGGVAMHDWTEFALDHICFQYPAGDRLALRDISARIVRRGVYGIVGPSGAGKSTLIDVVAGLLQPATGRVLVDGRPVDAGDLGAWRKRIGYVAQNPFILDASLRDNVLFGAAPDETRLQDALRAAQLGDLVAQLPEGVETRLGERGVRLSGGQRQRVAIARALFRHADVLILDEATSSLDSLSEREVNEAIARLAGRVTMLIIAHRLSTVRHCREIWVMEQGGLAARGDHEELMNISPLYRQIVELQFADAMPREPRKGAA